jgi:hypothetical protein
MPTESETIYQFLRQAKVNRAPPLPARPLSGTEVAIA